MPKIGGYAIWTDPEKKTIEKDTFQCCHCGGHFMIEKGSGRQRGWCIMCGAATCGHPSCNNCIPFIKKIEEQETKNRLYEVVIRG